MFAGEVKCLQCELETERWRVEQERAELAQQLLGTQQQCDHTLRLRETAHQGEIEKLLQDLVGNGALLSCASKLCGLALAE